MWCGCKLLVYFTQKKPTVSILHTYFYKTPTSVCLFYHLFYLNNHFSYFFFIISHRSHHLTKLSKISQTLSISLFSTFFLFLVSSSFPSPSYIFGTFIFFFSFSFSFFFFFFFYSSLIMASDFGFAILVVILGRFFQYMDGDFGALHWLLLLLLLLFQHLVLLLFLHFLLLLLQFGFDYLYGFDIYIYIYWGEGLMNLRSRLICVWRIWWFVVGI